MTYIERESGSVTGEPIELYEFVYPDKTYRYTTSLTPYNALNSEWTPAAIKRGSIKSDNRKGLLALQLTVPLTFEPSTIFKDFTTTRIPLRVYRTHKGDSEIFLFGQWFIIDVNFTNQNSIIRGGSISLLLQTELPRFFYQFQCNHELYSQECGVSPTFINGTIANVDPTDNRIIGLSLAVPEIVKLAVLTVGGELRLVTEAGGTGFVKVLEPFNYISVGDSFSLHSKGCDRSFDTCKTVFNNGNNFGGMPFIPRRNIFDGSF